MILRIKEIQQNVEMPTTNPYGQFDIRIHSFHKITEYDGIVEHNGVTFGLQSGERVLIKTGYAIEIDSEEKCLLHVVTRLPCALKDGLVVLGGIQITPIVSVNKEVEVILHNNSNNFILLKKGYRIAQGMIVVPLSTRIEIIE